MNDVTHYKDNAWSVFFWGLVICILLAIVVYLFG
jgi:hypothetical protein